MGELRPEEDGVLELREEVGGGAAIISCDGQFADYDGGDDVKFKEKDECTGKMSPLLTLSPPLFTAKFPNVVLPGVDVMSYTIFTVAHLCFEIETIVGCSLLLVFDLHLAFNKNVCKLKV